MIYCNLHLLFFCSFGFSLHAAYVPTNTSCISLLEAEDIVKKDYKNSRTAEEGLLFRLEEDEKVQLKRILQHLGFDADQACAEIERAKKEYRTLKSIDQNASWSIRLLRSFVPQLTQKLKKNNIDPADVSVHFLSQEEMKELEGSAAEPFTAQININNKKITIYEMKKTRSFELHLAYEISVTVLDHELKHLRRLHSIPRATTSALYSSLSIAVQCFKSRKYHALKNNLILSQESNAEQTAIIEQIKANKENYLEWIDQLSLCDIKTIQERDDNHLSLLDRYIAAYNIVNLLQAEQNLLTANRIPQSIYNNYHFKGLLAASTPSSTSFSNPAFKDQIPDYQY